MKNVALRAASGAIYVAVIVAAILCGQPAFLCLCLLLGVLAMLEFNKMCQPSDDSAMRWWVLGVDVVAVLAIIWWFAIAMYLYLPVRLAMAVFDKRSEALRSAAFSMLGVIYIGMGLGALEVLYTNDMLIGAGKYPVLMFFIMIWLNDTGAFCVGSQIGRRRLCERLSPKKSWEGFWGGMAFCALFGIAAYYLVPGNNLSLWGWIAIGVAVSALSTVGDLFESLIKRTVGVKDSGNLIPGHGGILDRIDSLLFVAPGLAAIFFACLYCMILLT